MKALLVSFNDEEVSDISECEVGDNYDGDPYGETVGFCVGSNQMIITEENSMWEEYHKMYANKNSFSLWSYFNDIYEAIQ